MSHASSDALLFTIIRQMWAKKKPKPKPKPRPRPGY